LYLYKKVQESSKNKQFHSILGSGMTPEVQKMLSEVQGTFY